YLFLMLTFPIILTGFLLFPAIVFNKKSLFFFVPPCEILLFLKCISLALPWHNGNIINMLRYYFTDDRIIHIPVIFIPALIFSIIVASCGANNATNFQDEMKKKKKDRLQQLYRSLDSIITLQETLRSFSKPILSDLNSSGKKVGGFVFESFDNSLLNLEFTNNFSYNNVELLKNDDKNADSSENPPVKDIDDELAEDLDYENVEETASNDELATQGL
ncbi:MAG: hypothetical protein RR322_04385, partial [Oscillospiraceae bacterium]